MNKKRFFSFKRFIIVIVLAVFVYTGCASSAKQIPIVVIRGENLRTEKMELPLNTERIEKLNEYLEKGGDRNIHDTVSFYKKVFYDGILELLDDDDSKIEMSDLFVKNAKGLWIVKEPVTKWFKKSPIQGVYNFCPEKPTEASAEDVNYDAFALHDGHLWWVFYPDEDDSNWLRYLQLTVPVEGVVPPSWKMQH